MLQNGTLPWNRRWSPAWLVLLLLAAGCSSESKPTAVGTDAVASRPQRIVLLTNGDNPFWDPCEAGAMEAAKDLKLEEQGYTVTFDRANFTVPGQLNKLRQYGLATDIVAVGISVYDNTSPAIAGELKKLKDKGIKIVTIDGDLDRERDRDVRIAYLGTNNELAGRELGMAVAALKPEGGNFAMFVGNKGNANAKARMDGFVEGAGEGYSEVERVDDGGKPEVARKTARDVLDRNPQVNILVGIWAYNGPACAQVAEERGIRDTTTIVTFDADEGSIRAMEDGKLDCMVVQNPFNMGYQGVRLLHALVADDQAVIDEMYPRLGEPEGDLYDTGLKIVVPNEGSPIVKDLFQDGTEFLKLDEFKDWLVTYNLRSS